MQMRADQIQDFKNLITQEKAYLNFIKNLYIEDYEFLDLAKNMLGIEKLPDRKKPYKYSERISKDDLKKIDKLEKAFNGALFKAKFENLSFAPDEESFQNDFNDLKEKLRAFYQKGYTKRPGLPAWMFGSSINPKDVNSRTHGSPLYLQLLGTDELVLPKYKSWLAKQLARFFGITDSTKRASDTTEDMFTVLWYLPITIDLSDSLIGRIIFGLNSGNSLYELFKGSYEIKEAAKSDDRYRAENLVKAIAHTIFAFLAVALCGVFFGSIIFFHALISVPVGLFGVSLIALSINTVQLLQKLSIYLDTNTRLKESSSEKFNEDLREATNTVVLSDSVEEKLGRAYQLTSMNYRKHNDKNAYLDAEREITFAAIEEALYLFIFIAACIGLALYMIPGGQVAAGIAASSLSIFGALSTVRVKFFQFIDDYRYDFSLTATMRKGMVGEEVEIQNFANTNTVVNNYTQDNVVEPEKTITETSQKDMQITLIEETMTLDIHPTTPTNTTVTLTETMPRNVTMAFNENKHDAFNALPNLGLLSHSPVVTSNNPNYTSPEPSIVNDGPK